MSRVEPRQVILNEFDRLWIGPQEPDLLLAALQVARVHYPELDVTREIKRVNALGRQAHSRVADASDEHERLLRLNAFLFDEMGFRGNREDYYDPRNSCLNDVIDRRTGIPISLSVLYMAVGQRAGLTLKGIGLPAHLVVHYEARDPDQQAYVDPFYQQILPDRDACQRLISRIIGRPVTLSDRDFQPQPVRDIILRMLANLKGAYLRQGDFEHTIEVMDRILILLPNNAQQWRDRGLLLYHQGSYSQASFDLTRALWLAELPSEQQQQIESVLEHIEAVRLRLN